jgi:hypothetical protein
VRNKPLLIKGDKEIFINISASFHIHQTSCHINRESKKFASHLPTSFMASFHLAPEDCEPLYPGKCH